MVDMSQFGSPWFTVAYFQDWARRKHTAEAEEGVVVTITAFDFAKMRDPNTLKDVSNPVIWFDDETRGLICTPAITESLIPALGTSESDEWIGRRVGLRLQKVQKKLAIRAYRVDQRAPEAHPQRSIGDARARKVVEKLRERGTNWSEFLAHMKSVSKPLRHGERNEYEQLTGIEIADAPEWALKRIAAWLESRS